MKTPGLYLPFIISFSIFTGCSTFKATPENINQLVNQQQYDKAIASYQELSEKDKASINLKDLQKSRSKYEKTNIAYIKKLQQKKQYEQAREQLAKAQQNIPSSEALKKLQQKQTKIEQQHQQKYQLKYNKVLADFYLKEAPLIKQLAKVESGEPYQALVQTREQEIKDVANSLGEQGMQAYAKKDTQTANEFLGLANQLQPTPLWKKTLARMAKTKKKKQVVAQKKAAKKTSSHLEKLQNTYNQQFAQSAWLKARATLKKVSTLKLSSKEQQWLNSEKDRLHNITNSIAQEKNKRGKVLYSKGYIEKALATWKEGLQYAPKSQDIKDNIERAEKFQQKFNALKK